MRIDAGILLAMGCSSGLGRRRRARPHIHPKDAPHPEFPAILGHHQMGDFKRQYVDLCEKHFPLLRPGASMIKAGGSPHKSRAMIFDPAILPSAAFLPRMRIVHSLRGDANVNFYGWGDRIDDLKSIIYTDLMNTNFRFMASGNRRGGTSSLIIYVPAPAIDPFGSFDHQKEQIVSGLVAVESLRRWIFANLDKVKVWAEVIARSAPR